MLDSFRPTVLIFCIEQKSRLFLQILGGYWAIEGGQSVEDETFSEILIFNKDLKSWTKTDYLFKPRFSHAVSALPLDKIQPHCNA